jgi:RNA recognition motif-containing protein
MNLSSNSSETRLSEDFDYLLNMIFSSPSPIITDSQILADNPEVSTEKNVTQTFHQPSQPTISKTIFLSNLPVTVNRRQLRTMFPRCNKIVLKTNHWNKDLRL